MVTVGTKEAAERLGIEQWKVAKMCRQGQIDGAEQDQKGSPWHIPEKTIDKMLKNKCTTYK